MDSDEPNLITESTKGIYFFFFIYVKPNSLFIIEIWTQNYPVFYGTSHETMLVFFSPMNYDASYEPTPYLMKCHYTFSTQL